MLVNSDNIVTAEKVERSKASSSTKASNSVAGSAFSSGECVNCVTWMNTAATLWEGLGPGIGTPSPDLRHSWDSCKSVECYRAPR